MDNNVHGGTQGIDDDDYRNYGEGIDGGNHLDHSGVHNGDHYDDHCDDHNGDKDDDHDGDDWNGNHDMNLKVKFHHDLFPVLRLEMNQTMQMLWFRLIVSPIWIQFVDYHSDSLIVVTLIAVDLMIQPQKWTKTKPKKL